MKVLFVDDSQLARTMFQRSLGEQHDLIPATSGFEAIERCFVDKPDLVVLDLILPDLNGLDVLRRLRELNPDVPVVIGTADNQDLTRQEALRLGAAGYLVKPYTPDNVKQALAGLITL